MTRRDRDELLEQASDEMVRLTNLYGEQWQRVEGHLATQQTVASNPLAESQAVARRVAALGERGAR